MEQSKLNEILELHNLWLYNNEKGVRANLRGADLEEANLRGADLEGANLEGADLEEADLREANLRGADLRWANLRWADLEEADLREANLRWADLEGANLRGADLEGANLEGADLEEADLEGAIKIPMYCKWTHGITDNMIHIGCEKRSIDELDKFFQSDEVIQTPRNTPEFTQIQAVYNAYKAYLETINNK